MLIVNLLMSFGGSEAGIRKRLEGLDYVMAEQGLAPDARLAQWVLAMAALSPGELRMLRELVVRATLELDLNAPRSLDGATH